MLTLRGDAWTAAGIAVWIFVFPYYWRSYKDSCRRDAEESQALPYYGPLEKLWWGIALLLTAVNVADWVLLIGFEKTHL